MYPLDWLDPIDPQDLLRFLAVAEAGSFQAAADRLHVDRSVVSRRVAALEKTLGVRLLRRSTRSLSLTEAGVAVAARGRRLHALLGEVRQIADETRLEARGLLRITSSTHFGNRYVLPAVLQYQRLYPHVIVELELDNRHTDLIADGFDLAVRIGEPKDSRIIARKLCSNPVCLVASHEFIARHGSVTSLPALLQLPAASYSAEGMCFEQLEYLDEMNARRSAPMHVAFWSNNAETLYQAVKGGVGWGCMSRFVVHQDLVDGHLEQLLPQLLLPPYNSVYVVYSQRELPLRAQLFLDLLHGTVTDDLWSHPHRTA
ncbi:LysR family transcriptional regulator [Comamonas humi]